LGFKKEQGLFFLKRNLSNYPNKIDSIVVDLDYTLLNALTALTSLERLLGKEEAQKKYQKQKTLVKKGKMTFADVKKWGHELQVEKGWTLSDWQQVAEELYLSGKLNKSIVEALKEIKLKNKGVKIILATGTSDVLGRQLARILADREGLKIDFVVGSQQYFSNDGKVNGLKYFVGDKSKSIPTISKIDAIKNSFKSQGLEFNPKKSLAISDSDSELLRACGIGVLIPVSKSEDPLSAVSQRFRLRDVESKYSKLRKEFITALALHPQKAIKLALRTIKTNANEKIDLLTRSIFKDKINDLKIKIAELKKKKIEFDIMRNRFRKH